MAGGIAALLDDIAALAKMAAASVDDVAAAAGRASAKAAGVVVDDTAVTPRYVHGVDPKQELPIIKRIAVGSLRNKLLFILPAALLLSQFAPWALTPLLMLGGSYLCFEGAEKVYEHFFHKDAAPAQPTSMRGPEAEKQVVKGAIRTDFILSAEIMVIALNEVSHEPFWSRAIILVVVALGITVLVYGVVGLIVKMDDIGLALAGKQSPAAQKFGRGLVAAMPKVLAFISVAGVFAMLWVGGHIILVGMADLGFTPIYEWVHGLGQSVHHLAAVGPMLAWLIETFFAMVLGILWGGVIVAVLHVLPFGKKHGNEHSESIRHDATDPDHTDRDDAALKPASRVSSTDSQADGREGSTALDKTERT